VCPCLRAPVTQTILFVPLMERLLCGARHVAVIAPGIQPIVNCEAWQRLERSFSSLCRNAVSLRITQHFASYDHRLFLWELDLMLLVHHRAPGIDLLVNIDLYRAHVGTASVQGRRERQFAIAANVKGRHRNKAYWPHVCGPITKTAAAAKDGTSVHASSAPNAFQRRPELFHAKPRRAAVVHDHNVHLAAFARAPEVRSVLGDWHSRRAPG